jgi:hypothetical protein
MNIGVLTGLIGIFLGSAIAYHFVSPHGTLLGVCAAVGAAFIGWFIGYAAGFLIILPFEGLARLHRFFTTGRWTDPALKNHPRKPPEAKDSTA